MAVRIILDLNNYQKLLHMQMRNAIGPLPPAILGLGLAERSGEICSQILDFTLDGSLLNNPETTNILKETIARLMAYSLQLYSSLDIDSESALTEVFTKILNDEVGSPLIRPGYIDKDSILEQGDENPEEINDDDNDNDDDDDEEPDEQINVFER